MGLITTRDCIDRTRPPYTTSEGWLLSRSDALVDLAVAQLCSARWMRADGPFGLLLRVPITRHAPSLVVLEALQVHAGTTVPSVSASIARVDGGGEVVEGWPADGVWTSPPSAEKRRIVAIWASPPTSPPAPGTSYEAHIVISGPAHLSLGEAAAWTWEGHELSPRASDDIHDRGRIEYAVSGIPIMPIPPAMSRRLSVSTRPEQQVDGYEALRRAWLRQGLAALTLQGVPNTVTSNDRAQWIGERLIIGLPTAGSMQIDGLGAGGMVGSVQLGLIESGLSPISLIEEAIMSLAAYSLAPHAYRPMAGEWIAGFSGATLTTQASAANRYEVWPMVMPVDTAIDQVAVDVVTAATGDARVVIHASDDLGRPAGLFAQSSVFSTNTAGLRTGTISATLRAGQQYWVGIWTQGAPTLRAVSDAWPISWQYTTPPVPRRVLRRSVTWGGSGPTWVYSSSDPVSALPTAVLLRVA